MIAAHFPTFPALRSPVTLWWSRSRTLDAPQQAPHRIAMRNDSLETEDARAALIRAIATQGDRSAFIRLFDFYAPRIKAQTMRFGLSPETAEDIVQDAMLAVWRRAGQFDAQRGSASAWVFTIATNARIDRLRRDKRLASARELDDEVLSLAVAPEEGSGFDAARLAQHISKLPDEQRRMLQLSFYSEISHGDIAQRLGVPLGTVKSRIRLALSKLRQALRDEA